MRVLGDPNLTITKNSDGKFDVRVAIPFRFGSWLDRGQIYFKFVAELRGADPGPDDRLAQIERQGIASQFTNTPGPTSVVLAKTFSAGAELDEDWLTKDEVYADVSVFIHEDPSHLNEANYGFVQIHPESMTAHESNEVSGDF